MSDDAGARLAHRPGEEAGGRVERQDKVVRLGSLAAARQVLRERHSTTQAGFTAEYIPKGLFRNHPILLSDGPDHDRQRADVSRFFAPKVVHERYGTLMVESARRHLGSAAAKAEFNLDDVTLHFTVEVTAEIVGLTESSVKGLSGRLVAFFRQPPMDITKPDLGRTKLDWMKAAFHGITPVARFWFRDVRPAIRARRRHPQGDVISHLISKGHSSADIAVECVTYGTAGMVTTREFICMAAWHLLSSDDLRNRFSRGDERERLMVLAEIIRLEPVVGHLYRRVQKAFEVTDADTAVQLEKGDLVDLAIRDINTDPQAVGEEPMRLCPGRRMPRGVDATGMSFGDGAHRCPGRDLALLEADVFLQALLELDPEVVAEPEIEWDDVIEGYGLRGLRIRTRRSDRVV